MTGKSACKQVTSAFFTIGSLVLAVTLLMLMSNTTKVSWVRITIYVAIVLHFVICGFVVIALAGDKATWTGIAPCLKTTFIVICVIFGFLVLCDLVSLIYILGQTVGEMYILPTRSRSPWPSSVSTAEYSCP